MEVVNGQTAAVDKIVFQRAVTRCQCVHATATRDATVPESTQSGITMSVSLSTNAKVRITRDR